MTLSRILSVIKRSRITDGVLFVTRSSATSLSILLSCPTMYLISFDLTARTEHDERVSSLSSHGCKSRETRSSYTFPHANAYLYDTISRDKISLWGILQYNILLSLFIFFTKSLSCKEYTDQIKWMEKIKRGSLYKS